MTIPGVTLRAYEQPVHSKPVVLIIPAPIKRAYIWDTLPRVSVVRRYLENHLQVYLIQWERPSDTEERFGLAEYADSLILRCLDAIRAETGQKRCSLQDIRWGERWPRFSPLCIQSGSKRWCCSLALAFGSDIGAFDTMVAALMRTHLTDALPGNVPGSVLDTVSYPADPNAFGRSRWVDWLDSQTDPEALQTHFLVERWSLDEMPLARRLVEEIVEWLYREDRYMGGDIDGLRPTLDS